MDLQSWYKLVQKKEKKGHTIFIYLLIALVFIYSFAFLFFVF